MSESPLDTVQLLEAHTAGNPDAASQLLPLVYDELRALAGRYMRGERPDHTLQPTALVHEAFIRLVDSGKVDWRGRSHFIAIAAVQMRRILVEYARAHRAEKRGGSRKKVTLDDTLGLTSGHTLDLLFFDEALQKLKRKSPRQCRLAELRCFAGLSSKEIAYILGVSERTARHDWLVARAWLRRELGMRARPGG